jgi:hypothetical protein
VQKRYRLAKQYLYKNRRTLDEALEVASAPPLSTA